MTETERPEAIAELDSRTDSVVVSVRGEIDLANDAELRQALHEGGETAGDRPVIVDLTAVSFFASTGASAVADAFSRARDAGGGLAMVLARDTTVHRVLSMMGLTGLIPTFFSLSEALEAVADGPPPS